jgi:hypothetical protein
LYKKGIRMCGIIIIARLKTIHLCGDKLKGYKSLSSSLMMPFNTYSLFSDCIKVYV